MIHAAKVFLATCVPLPKNGPNPSWLSHRHQFLGETQVKLDLSRAHILHANAAPDLYPGLIDVHLELEYANNLYLHVSTIIGLHAPWG